MNRFSIAALSLAALCGLAANAAPARAGDVEIGFGYADSGGFFGAHTTIPARRMKPPHIHGPKWKFDSWVEAPAYPIAAPAPTPIPYPSAPIAGPAWPITPAAPFGPARPDDGVCREVIPAHDVVTEETVCVPAIYEDRVVPVMKTVCVPVFREVCVPEMQEVTVPVFEERRVPLLGFVVDKRSGRRVAGKVGEKIERVQVGTRVESVKVGEHFEKVKVGERKERVQVGERTEHVLVRAETTRVVPHVAARRVTVVEDGMPVAGLRLSGEVMTRSDFEAEMALVRGDAMAVARR